MDYLLFDSTHRNRQLDENPSTYTMTLNKPIRSTALTSLDPYADALPSFTGTTSNVPQSNTYTINIIDNDNRWTTIDGFYTNYYINIGVPSIGVLTNAYQSQYSLLPKITSYTNNNGNINIELEKYAPFTKRILGGISSASLALLSSYFDIEFSYGSAIPIKSFYCSSLGDVFILLNNYTSKNQYFFLSNDYGQTFIQIQLPTSSIGIIISCAALSYDGRYIILGILFNFSSYTLIYSNNYGLSFSLVSITGINTITDIAMDFSGQYAMISTNNGILLSTNYGLTWNSIGIYASIGLFINSLPFLYIFTAGTTYISNNNGVSFFSFPNPFNNAVNNAVVSITANLDSNFMLISLVKQGVFISSNYGINWTLYLDPITQYGGAYWQYIGIDTLISGTTPQQLVFNSTLATFYVNIPDNTANYNFFNIENEYLMVSSSDTYIDNVTMYFLSPINTNTTEIIPDLLIYYSSIIPFSLIRSVQHDTPFYLSKNNFISIRRVIGFNDNRLVLNSEDLLASFLPIFVGNYIYVFNYEARTQSRLITNYDPDTNSITLQYPLDPPMVANLFQTPMIGIASFTADNYNPMVYNINNKLTRTSIPLLYEIELLWINIPTYSLISGGNLSNYPYFMINIYNPNSINTNQYFYSNNIKTATSTFIIPNNVFNNNQTFFNLSHGNKSIIYFNPGDTLKLDVLLPNGNTIIFNDKDNIPDIEPPFIIPVQYPISPKRLNQISILIKLKPINK